MAAVTMKRILWAALNVLQWLFICLWTAVWVTVALLLVTVTRRTAYGLAMARRIWAPGIAWGAMAVIEVSGAERIDPRRAWFFASNHQSFADIPTLFRALPANLRFVAKRELRAVPFLGWYMEGMGMVFIDRTSRRSGLAGVETAAAILRQGESVLSFPAGTRRTPGEPLHIKGAALAPAIQAAVTVVPVAVHGSSAVLATRGPQLRPGRILVHIGEPIATQGMTL